MEKVKHPRTLLEAIRYFTDPAVCLNFLAALRWPNGVTCPRCGSKEVGEKVQADGGVREVADRLQERPGVLDLLHARKLAPRARSVKYIIPPSCIKFHFGTIGARALERGREARLHDRADALRDRRPLDAPRPARRVPRHAPLRGVPGEPRDHPAPPRRSAREARAARRAPA